jgi:hypothetical protein
MEFNYLDDFLYPIINYHRKLGYKKNRQYNEKFNLTGGGKKRIINLNEIIIYF